MTERIVNVERVEDLISVFGSLDENIHRIEQELGVQILNRGSDLKISGEEEAADKAARTIEGLMALASKGEIIDEQKVRYLITLVQSGNDDQVAQMARDVVCITAKGKPIKAKTIGQQKYMKAIPEEHHHRGCGSCRYRQNLPGCGRRRSRFPGADCEPDHSDPTGGGGRGAPGLFARRSAKQG